MPQNDVAILEFGSSKITVIIARRGINNTFDVKGEGVTPYAGFCDGEFLEPDDLKMCVNYAITTAETAARARIKDIFVGVPGEFTVAVSKEASMSFRSRQRVTQQHLDELYAIGDTFKGDPDYIVINRSPIYYSLDDNRRMIDPSGMATTKLSGLLSYILAERNYIKLMNGLLAEYGFRNVEYVSSLLAEALYLFEPDVRDRYALFCDVGYITTSVVLSRGDGILFMKSFSVGGGHVEADLAECLHIPFEQAQALKKRVALSLDVDDTDQYDIVTKEGTASFPARVVHDIVSARLENMAALILNCLDDCETPFPDYIPLYLSGGGISYIRGARETLAKYLKKPVELSEGGVPHYDKPHQASEYGLLDIALKNTQPKQGFWSRLLG